MSIQPITRQSVIDEIKPFLGKEVPQQELDRINTIVTQALKTIVAQARKGIKVVDETFFNTLHNTITGMLSPTTNNSPSYFPLHLIDTAEKITGNSLHSKIDLFRNLYFNF